VERGRDVLSASANLRPEVRLRLLTEACTIGRLVHIAASPLSALCRAVALFAASNVERAVLAEAKRDASPRAFVCFGQRFIGRTAVL
jgi:hypothetical protein